MPALLKRLRAELRPWMVVAVIALAYVIITLARFDWNPMSMVIVGSVYDPRVQNDSRGYDGQFSYQIAVDPLHASQYLDTPAYRYQRILYPILAWVISMGNPAAVPWVMLAINLTSLVLGTWLTEQILYHHGMPGWYALLYGLYIGLLMPVRLGLTEPLSFMLVQAGVLASLRRRSGLSAFAFGLACLARETAAVFAAGYAASLLFNKEYRRGVIFSLVSFLPMAAWQVVLFFWLGSFGLSSSVSHNAGIEILPYYGWWGHAFYNFQQFLVMSLFVVPIGIVPSILCLVASIRRILNGDHLAETWALLLNAALLMFLPLAIILDTMGLTRAVSGLVTATINYGAATKSRKVLNYALMWLIPDLFIYRDGLLPVAEEAIRRQPRFLP